MRWTNLYRKISECQQLKYLLKCNSKSLQSCRRHILTSRCTSLIKFQLDRPNEINEVAYFYFKKFFWKKLNRIQQLF